MSQRRFLPTPLAALLAGLFITPAGAATNDELEKRIDQLTQQLLSLKAELAATKATTETIQTNQSTLATQIAARPASSSEADDGDHYSPYLGNGSKERGFMIGGYGEANYNRYSNGSTSDSKASLRRAVLYVGNRFSDKLAFHSEIEYENAVLSPDEGYNGEVAVEQAFLEWNLHSLAKVRAGLQILPLGLLNRYHEPPIFHGVERNEVESRIIPSVWRELAFSLGGDTDAGWTYQAGVSTTPDASRFTAEDSAKFGIKDMRSLGADAAARNLGIFGALAYKGYPGLELGGAFFSGDTGQDGKGANPTEILKGVKAHLNLWETHARYEINGYDFTALYARGTLGDADKVNRAAATRNAVYGIGSQYGLGSAFYGWYLQAAKEFGTGLGFTATPFVRYERYNTQDKVPTGWDKDPTNDQRVVTAGIGIKPHKQVVFKVDYQRYQNDSNLNRLNLGVGYMF